MPLKVPALMQGARLMHQLLADRACKALSTPAAAAVGHKEEMSRERQGIISGPAFVRVLECNGIAKRFIRIHKE